MFPMRALNFVLLNKRIIFCEITLQDTFIDCNGLFFLFKVLLLFGFCKIVYFELRKLVIYMILRTNANLFSFSTTVRTAFDNSHDLYFIVLEVSIPAAQVSSNQ